MDYIDHLCVSDPDEPPPHLYQMVVRQLIETNVRKHLATHRPPGMLLSIRRESDHEHGECDFMGVVRAPHETTPGVTTYRECTCVTYRFVTKLPPT